MTRHSRAETGVVLIALLITLALVGVATLAAAEVSALARQRALEQELLFVGEQYRQAIERYYYAAPPGTPRVLPQSVKQLLLDDRYPQPVQHLRRPYADPFGGGDWVLLRDGNRIAGLRSAATVTTIKRANFPSRQAAFVAAADVSQWLFIFKPPAPAAAARPDTPRKQR